jgi:hypothetical protein
MNGYMRRALQFLLRTAEAWIWLTAVIFLALQEPGCDHYSLCPLHNLGITFCPGCGLGRSISLIFQGDFLASFRMHPLGMPAIVLLLWRSFKIIKSNLNTLSNQNKLHYG